MHVMHVDRNDFCLLWFAESLYGKHGREASKHDYICQKTRQLRDFQFQGQWSKSHLPLLLECLTIFQSYCLFVFITQLFECCASKLSIKISKFRSEIYRTSPVKWLMCHRLISGLRPQLHPTKSDITSKPKKHTQDIIYNIRANSRFSCS